MLLPVFTAQWYVPVPKYLKALLRCFGSCIPKLHVVPSQLMVFSKVWNINALYLALSDCFALASSLKYVCWRGEGKRGYMLSLLNCLWNLLRKQTNSICWLPVFCFRSGSALAQLYGTSATLEHHHFNHAVMILQSEVQKHYY